MDTILEQLIKQCQEAGGMPECFIYDTSITTCKYLGDRVGEWTDKYRVMSYHKCKLRENEKPEKRQDIV